MANIKLQYFIDHWLDLTAEESIEKVLIHSIVYNPKELFKEFSEEIKRNNLKNTDNKNLFIGQIKAFAKLGVMTLENFKHILALIQSQFDKKIENYNYLLHLLNLVLLELGEYKLGKSCIEELADIICDDNISLDEPVKKRIKSLVNLVYFELIHKGFSHKGIIDILHNVFSSYHEIDGNIITKFPRQIDHNVDKESYNQKIVDFINGLSTRDRILAINNYFNRFPQSVKFIFQIHGIKGDDSRLDYGDILIYNPKYTQIIVDDNLNRETFGIKNTEDILYFNAAVSVSIIDQEVAKNEAFNKLNKLLYLISAIFKEYKVPITINEDQYIIIDEDRKVRGFGAKVSGAVFAYEESIGMTLLKGYMDSFASQVCGDSLNLIEKSIIESCRCQKFAKEPSSFSEKILWNWVALENLFSNAKTIIEIVPKMLIKHQLFSFARDHYRKLINISDGMGLQRHYRKNVSLSSDLSEKLKDQNGIISLNNLIENIDNICTELTTEDLFTDQLKNLKDIFSDKKRCLDLLNDLERITREKIIYFYRIRNKIVHNANDIQGSFMEQYIQFATEITTIVIQKYISIKEELNLYNADQIVNHIAYSYDKFKLELNTDGTSILLK